MGQGHLPSKRSSKTRDAVSLWTTGIQGAWAESQAENGEAESWKGK